MNSVSILLGKLVPDPTQPQRSMSSDELDQLAENIRRKGQLLPLRVRPSDSKTGHHTIISGHRRYAAMLRLGLTHANCIIVEGELDEATILEEQLAENLFRENLSPIEEAKAIERFLKLKGCTASEATKQLHLSNARISRSLALLELTSNLQEQVHLGQLSPETAYHLSRLPEGELRQLMTQQALAGRLTRDAAARASRKEKSTKTAGNGIGRVSCLLDGGRTLTLSGESVKLDSFIETLEEVLKEARKARQQGWDVSTLAKVFRNRAQQGGAV